MMLAAMGPLYLLGRVYAGRSVEPTAFATAYGMSVIGAALGLLISSRCPPPHPSERPRLRVGDHGDASLHRADVVFLVVIAVSGLTMILSEIASRVGEEGTAAMDGSSHAGRVPRGRRGERRLDAGGVGVQRLPSRQPDRVPLDRPRTRRGSEGQLKLPGRWTGASRPWRMPSRRSPSSGHRPRPA